MSQGSQQGEQGQNTSSSAPPVVASSAGQTSTAQSTSVTTATGGGQPSVAVSSVGGGQPSVAAAPPVQAGVQQTANPVMSLKPLGSSKPPKFDDTFEVYQLRLRLYLQQRDSWKVVTGEEVRHPDNQVLQRQFDDRNSLAMETIIRGVKGDDAQKVCVYESAKAMWDTLVAEKTQRDFSYAVHLKREIYMHAYKPGQKMADYILEMNSLRQRLQRMGPSYIIDDTSMSQLLLMGVCAVHREIVTQFDFSYRQGNPPTLQQVKNALLSRDEMDKMAADTAGNSGVAGNGERVVMHMQSPNSGGKPGQGQPQTGQVQTTGAGKQRLKRCYHCKKLGHLRCDCWFYKNKQNKVKGKNGGGGQDGKEMGKKGGKGGSDDSTKSDKPTNGAMGYISHAGEPSESSSSDNEEFVGMTIKSDRRSPDGDWMLDSGTTLHVCIERDLFTSIKKSKSAFKVWDGGVTRGELCGSVVIPVMDAVTRKSMTLMLDKVEFSSSGPVNLISMGRMLKSGWTVSSSPGNELPVKMFLTRGNQRLEFIFHGEHFWLNNGSFGETSAVVMANVNADGGPLMRWHERLAHLNEAALKFMVKHDVVAGMDISEEQLKTKLKCLSCMSAQQKRKSYGNATDKRTTVSFERLTSDVCDMGAYLPGIGVSRYFQLIHDEGSRYKWCYIIGKKREASGNVQRLIAELLAQGKLIKKFTSDGGGEYVNTELKEFLKSKGIVFIPTHSYTPEENCLVEKMNGVLVNKMRAVMHAANLPSVLWPEVLQYVVEVDNLSPTKALKGLTPTEKLTGSKPNIEGLKVCGCVAYVFVPKENRKNKLSAKAEPALFLGLPKTGHGYRLLHLRTGKMVEARDVKFREDVTVERTYVNALLKRRQSYYPQIPFVPLPVEYVAEQSVRAGAVDSVRAAINDIAGTESTDNRHVHVEDEQPRQECQDDRVVAELVGENASDHERSSGVTSVGDVSADSVGDASDGSMNDNELMPTADRLRPWSQRRGNKKSADNQPRRSSKRLRGLRRSERQKKANVRLKDYIMASVEAMEELSGNPASAEEALNSPQRDKWLDAMRLEMDAHRVNGTWRLVDRPKQPCNILKTIWVLRVKLNEKGKVDRRKGRLAVCGCGQKYGVDYIDTYSPVVRIERVRMLLILAFLLDLDCCYVDFVTAFLNGELKGVKIYMEQPEYFDDGSGRVCELLKGLYGLKQASRFMVSNAAQTPAGYWLHSM